MIIICYVLAFIGLKLRVERTRNAKLISFLSWAIMIAFGCLHFKDMAATQDLLGVIFITRRFTPNISLLIIEGIILLAINLLTVKNKFKAIIFTLTQVGASVVVILTIILLVVGLFSGGSANTAPTSTSDSIGYSYDQNTEARNKGYSNALDAERSGRKWNGSTWE